MKLQFQEPTDIQAAAERCAEDPEIQAEPYFSLIVPVLNEERYIERCLASLIKQVPVGRGEIMVVDGGSIDRTVEIVSRLCQSWPNLRLLENPERIQSAAMNLGARHASPHAKYLIRADAHSEYPANFVSLILNAFRSTGACSVVVPMHAVGHDGFHVAIAAVQNSLLGTGGAAHRMGTVSRYVDHGHHAGFDRAMFERIGGYNTTFTHNEDAEYDFRAVQVGGRIWLCSEARIRYFPRRELGGLMRQYFLFGGGRMRTFLLHRQRIKLRQLAPIVVLFVNLLALVLSSWVPALLIIPTAYFAVCFAWSAVLAWRTSDLRVIGGAIAAVAMHHSWSAGALWEFARQSLHRHRRTRERANLRLAAD